MKKWLKIILIGTVGLILLNIILFYSVREYLFVNSEKSFGEYSTRKFLSFDHYLCVEEVVTETGSLQPLFRVNSCKSKVESIDREGDWFTLWMGCPSGGVLKKNLKTGEEQYEGRVMCL